LVSLVPGLKGEGGVVFGPEREKIRLWWVAAAWFMKESGFGFFFRKGGAAVC
jgi:hypothetical protein